MPPRLNTDAYKSAFKSLGNPECRSALVVDKLMAQIIPVVDDYLKGDLHMLAILVRAAAERFDVEADVFVREHEALEAIFRQARTIPALAAAVSAVGDEMAGFRLSVLRARNYRELERLATLHAAVDNLADRPPELIRMIETILADRIVLHAIKTGPYPTLGLGERQIVAMLGKRSDTRV